MDHGITPSMWLPGQGPGQYWNSSSITSEIKMTLGKGTSYRSWPLSNTCQKWAWRVYHLDILPSAYSLSCSLCSRQRSCLCLMLYRDMPCQLDQEIPQSKLTYHMLIYPHYHPVWVQLGTCLNLIINLIWWLWVSYGGNDIGLGEFDQSSGARCQSSQEESKGWSSRGQSW